VIVGVALVLAGCSIGTPSSTTRLSGTGSASTATRTSTTVPGHSLRIIVQPVNDHVSPDASVLQPTTCVLRGSEATAAGIYSGFVAQGYLRVGDVVELYVYTEPMPGYPEGLQLGVLSSERPAAVVAGTGASWTTTVPVNLTLGTPAVCAVTVQATHQFEGASNAY
jgi:hypothetical protein